MDSDLWREILLNGSIVLLVGAFFIDIANTFLINRFLAFFG